MTHFSLTYWMIYHSLVSFFDFIGSKSESGCNVMSQHEDEHKGITIILCFIYDSYVWTISTTYVMICPFTLFVIMLLVDIF